MRKPGLIFVSLILAVSLAAHHAGASEVDPYTYGFVYLEDAAPALNQVLTSFIGDALAEVTAELLRARQGGRRMSDTEIEFRFFRAFERLHMQDVAFGIMEKCISSNDCDGWPSIERIQLRPEESIFHEAKWKFTPAKFYVSSVVNVCGVRFGADKLTHFFDDGFRYYNASRSKRLNYSIEDLQHLSMVFERTWMGAVLTGVVSYADVEANIAGVRFYRSMFLGDEPLLVEH